MIHLGFEIPYLYQGVVHKYCPDFIVQLMNVTNLIIEIKGTEPQQDRAKWEYLREWIQAVNEHGGFGIWDWGVVTEPNKILSLLT